ncbi:MAG: GNAT family N-acetyltransferase [Actinomycetota bacterium]
MRATCSPSREAPDVRVRHQTGGPPDIAIRIVDDAGAAAVAERLQREVWGMPPGEVVPVHQLITAARWGGVLLVAYAGDDPVGFCYGFVGLDDGRPVLCSHMLGVVPERRRSGIGFALKLEQRRLARERGLDRVVWTFDPLEARNAYLNLHKLDAFARHYYVDAYGPMDDELNRSLPSDRLLVEWHLDEARPSASRPPSRIEASTPVVNTPRSGAAVPAPGDADVRAGEGSPEILVAVPAHVAKVKERSAALALAWRLNVRQAMTQALSGGFRATDLIPGEEGVSFYVFTRGER